MQDFAQEVSHQKCSTFVKLLGHRVCVVVRDANDVIPGAAAYQDAVSVWKVVFAAIVPSTAANPVTMLTTVLLGILSRN